MALGSVIVTGGSRGIGKASSVLLAKKGYDVFFTWQKDEKASNELLTELKSYGGNAHSFNVDLSEHGSIVSFFDYFKENSETKLVGLVNNAAISGERKMINDYSIEEIEKTFAINLFGSIEFIKKSLPYMFDSEVGASIVNISSQAALYGGNNLSVYAATKGALNSLTIALSKELGGNKIRVNAISPGIIATDQNKALTELQKQGLFRQIPLGRLGEADDVASLVTWLISDESSYISGAIIPVHGAR